MTQPWIGPMRLFRGEATHGIFALQAALSLLVVCNAYGALHPYITQSLQDQAPAESILVRRDHLTALQSSLKADGNCTRQHEITWQSSVAKS